MNVWRRHLGWSNDDPGDFPSRFAEEFSALSGINRRATDRRKARELCSVKILSHRARCQRSIVRHLTMANGEQVVGRCTRWGGCTVHSAASAEYRSSLSLVELVATARRWCRIVSRYGTTSTSYRLNEMSIAMQFYFVILLCSFMTRATRNPMTFNMTPLSLFGNCCHFNKTMPLVVL